MKIEPINLSSDSKSGVQHKPNRNRKQKSKQKRDDTHGKWFDFGVLISNVGKIAEPK